MLPFIRLHFKRDLNITLKKSYYFTSFSSYKDLINPLLRYFEYQNSVQTAGL